MIGSILKRGEIYLLSTWLPAFYLNLASILLGAAIMWLGNYELLPWAKETQVSDELVHTK